MVIMPNFGQEVKVEREEEREIIFSRKEGEILQGLYKVSKTLVFLVAVLFVLFGTSQLASAAEWKDGEYSVSYSVLKADSDSASMADGYFVKPAKIIVKNGAVTAQVSINTSSIKEFKVNGKAVTVLSQSGESSTVQFAVPDLTSLTNAEIHVVVDGMDYDHWYTIRFDFDHSNVSVASSSTNTTTSTTSSGTTASTNTSTQETASSQESQQTKVENPRTSDTTNVSLYAALLLVSTIVMISMVVVKSKSRMIEK